MTETRTLEFENARAVQSLYANDLKLIKNLEESLGVKVTTREGWIKLEGEPAQIEKAERVFLTTGRGAETRRRYPAARVQLRAQLGERSTRRQPRRSRRDQDHDVYAEAADRRAGRWGSGSISRRFKRTTWSLASGQPGPGRLISRSRWLSRR